MGRAMSKENLAAAAAELTGWRDGLVLGAFKQPKSITANALVALRNAPEWEGVLGYDEFALAPMALHPPPWERGKHNSWKPRRWTDNDDTATAEWLQRADIAIDRISAVAAAVRLVAAEHSFHPIRDYLACLDHDGGERVAGFAANMLGAEPTPYHEAVSKSLLVSAVARILEPGCKHDCMPVLEGRQGAGKSTALRILFSRPWFSDDLAELGSKDASMQVRSAWCLEVAELSAMSGAETEKIKAFLSRSVDRFRPSYGRHVIEVPRQSVLIGTTNADAYLKDETGARRFLPVRCGEIKLKQIERCRDQLWAEAVQLYEQNARGGSTATHSAPPPRRRPTGSWPIYGRTRSPPLPPRQKT